MKPEFVPVTRAGHSIRGVSTARRIRAMSGLRSLTLQEKNALAVLADAVHRCRKEDMRTPEVLSSLDLLARRTATRSRQSHPLHIT